jgi:hypothetical protein
MYGPAHQAEKNGFIDLVNLAQKPLGIEGLMRTVVGQNFSIVRVRLNLMFSLSQTVDLSDFLMMVEDVW